MQIFYLVRNTAITIGWLMTPRHIWFGKYELRQIKNLMADLGRSYIFTVLLYSQVNLNFVHFNL
jgi:hypothetical protein